MKTDRLIEILSTNVEPVKPGRVSWMLVWALAVGGLAAFGVMLTTIGLRTNAGDWTHLAFLALKLLFTLSVVGAGAAFLMKSMRPGQTSGKPFAFVFLPFLAFGSAAIVALSAERPAAWEGMVLGAQWSTALVCVPLFAIIPMAALIWALRKGAPTNLTRTGAIAGLVAGALGAAAYALYCPSDSLPFIAICYGSAMLLTAFSGALLGRWLLRW